MVVQFPWNLSGTSCLLSHLKWGLLAPVRIAKICPNRIRRISRVFAPSLGRTWKAAQPPTTCFTHHYWGSILLLNWSSLAPGNWSIGKVLLLLYIRGFWVRLTGHRVVLVLKNVIESYLGGIWSPESLYRGGSLALTTYHVARLQANNNLLGLLSENPHRGNYYASFWIRVGFCGNLGFFFYFLSKNMRVSYVGFLFRVFIFGSNLVGGLQSSWFRILVPRHSAVAASTIFAVHRSSRPYQRQP